MSNLHIHHWFELNRPQEYPGKHPHHSSHRQHPHHADWRSIRVSRLRGELLLLRVYQGIHPDTNECCLHQNHHRHSNIRSYRHPRMKDNSNEWFDWKSGRIDLHHLESPSHQVHRLHRYHTRRHGNHQSRFVFDTWKVYLGNHQGIVTCHLHHHLIHRPSNQFHRRRIHESR